MNTALHLYSVKFNERIRVSMLVVAADTADAKRQATYKWHKHCHAAINEQMTTTAVLGFSDACRFEVERIPNGMENLS